MHDRKGYRTRQQALSSLGEGDDDFEFPDFGIVDDTIESDNYGDFYPGSGQESTENVSPITKTLLSTVTIVSDFGTAAGAGSGVYMVTIASRA